MKFGDVCRARCSAPARYIGSGKALFVSAMDNDLGINDAIEPIGGEERLPLPSDDALKGAAIGLSLGSREDANGQLVACLEAALRELVARLDMLHASKVGGLLLDVIEPELTGARAALAKAGVTSSETR